MAFFHPVPGNPYCWNRVIPGVLTDAMTYDEMIAHAMWKMDKIVDYLIHTVPYLIQVELDANSESCTLTGFLYDNYEKREFNHTFTVGGSPDGKYYVNYRSAGPGVEPISETDDPIFVSQEYMPMNCTTLYSFAITDEKIDPASVQFNDLYTGMHNADPDAHKALFDAVYAKIDAEIAEVNESLAAETAARQAADTQLQNNIDAEATAREQADTQLQNNIDAEETARQQADTNLQGQITSNDNDISALTTRVGTAESDITALEGRMGTAETNITSLQSRMSTAETNIGDNATAISNEAATRQSEDEALATQISNETQQRQQQDTQLNASISANTQAIAALNDGTGTVKTVNNLTGAVTLAPGNNVTITPSGNTLTIAATGGGGAGVSSVNGATGAVNLKSTSGDLTITPSGSNINMSVASSVSASYQNYVGFTGAGVPYTSVESIPEVTVSHGAGQFTITLPKGVAGLFKNSSTSFTNLDTYKSCAVPDTAFTTSGMYIIYITPGTTTANVMLASAPGDPGQIPLIALWVAIDAEGNIVDWTWDGIAVKKKPAAPPPETFYVTLNMLDDFTAAKTVSAPAFKVSDKLLILGNWSYVGATLNNPFAIINLSVLGYTTMPTRSMGGVITTYGDDTGSSWGQADFGGTVSNCFLSVSGTLSNSTWVMAPFYFIWE